MIDADVLAEQREWSEATFGPRHIRGPLGPLDHIEKEIPEVKDDPYDVEEWADIILLGFDGALRTGADPQEILDIIAAKRVKNQARTWPDWRDFADGEAIEHVRGTHD